MAKGEHHRIHAHDRVQRNRRRIAQEAARLMSEHGIGDYRHAKLKAAGHLRIDDEQALPRNREVEQALREHQRLFRADQQPQALRVRREAAAQAMHFFASFQPRLVGPVLDGTADAHSSVSLHLFSDDPDAVPRFLVEHDIPFQPHARRLRMSRSDSAEFPAYLFAADDLPFDLTVLPHDLLRQAPLDRIDERRMQRASLGTLQSLLAEDEIVNYERRGAD